MFRFRHALVRDATYATLTEEDRKLGHRLAASVLEQQAGASALALAEHWVRGAVPERAVAHLRAAATRALEGNDIRGAVTFSERALALSPDRADRGVLHATACEAYRWLGDYVRATEHGLASIETLDEGSVAWFLAVGEYIAACAYRRDSKSAAPQLARAQAVKTSSREARNAQIVCVARGCTQHLHNEYFDAARVTVGMIKAEGDDTLDDKARGWVHWLTAMHTLHDGDLGVFVRETEASLGAFERLGDVRNATSQRTNLGYAQAELGAFERAETQLRRVHRDAERMGLPMICAYALQNLGNVLRGLGRLTEARDAERSAVTIAASWYPGPPDRGRRCPCVRGAHAMVELGESETAIEEGRRAAAQLEGNPALLGLAKGVLAYAFLAQNRLEEGAVHLGGGHGGRCDRGRGRRDVHSRRAGGSARTRGTARRSSRGRARGRATPTRARGAHPRRRSARELLAACAGLRSDRRHRRASSCFDALASCEE